MAQALLHKVIFPHGSPQQLLSDHGSQFHSEVLQVLSHSLGIKQVFTSPYHPQTNGLTERMNKTIKQVISAYVDPLHQSWDQVLPFAVHTYNTSVRHPHGSALSELYTAGTRTSHQISIPSKCNPKRMTQMNGDFISNSINHCFVVRSNTIYVWHNKDRRNTMMHPICRWSYRLERVSEFIILSVSPDSVNPSCIVGSGHTQSRHALAHRRIVCSGQPIHPKQSPISIESSTYLQLMLPHARMGPQPNDDQALYDLTIIIRCPHSKNVASSFTLFSKGGGVIYV